MPEHLCTPFSLDKTQRGPLMRKSRRGRRSCRISAVTNMRVKIGLFVLLVLVYFNSVADCASRHIITKRNYSDGSVRGYLAERTCWWNEVCKEEFHSKFRCRCPRWSYCRAPGRYYDAHCSITRTGYIWTQPELSVALDSVDK